jgi:PAS domain S-box-containing protein
VVGSMTFRWSDTHCGYDPDRLIDESGMTKILDRLESVLKSGAVKAGINLEVLSGITALIGLYLISLHHYLLFHVLAELFSIVIGVTLFIVAWHLRRAATNQYILLIGIAYLFVAVLDTFHTLSYKGMGVFSIDDADTATQLWVAARFLQGASLLAAPYFLKRKLNSEATFFLFSVLAALILGSIYIWNIFPASYIEGTGLTPFKIATEYIISFLLLLALIFLYQNRSHFDAVILRWIGASIVATIGSEMAFTFYVGVYGLSNLVGHFLKIIAFYLIYKAVIQTAFIKPYDLLFRDLIRQQEALREEKRRAQSYLDVAGIIVILNIDQTIALINQSGCRLLGCEEREVIGKNGFDTFVPERIRNEAKAAFSKRITGALEGIDFYENPILTGSGEERMIRWHSSLLKDENGRITAVLSAGEDITEWKKAEAERAQLATFPQLNPNPLVEVDLTGKVLFLNPVAERLLPDLRRLGAEHPWLEGWEAWVGGFLGDRVQEGRREIAVGERWYNQTMYFVEEIGRIRIYGLDITKRKRAEETLLKIHEELEQRVRERTSQLDAANRQLTHEIEERKKHAKLLDLAVEELHMAQRALQQSHAELERRVVERTAELEAANRELESFSYSVSHDLQTPLRAIDGYARMILRKHADRFDEETRQKFNTIRSNAQMMGRLINDLLSFSRLGRTEITPSKLNMDGLLVDAWKELQVIHPERKMKLNVKDMPPAFGDRMLIKQVLLNLLSNAIKFTRYREDATIEAGGYADGQYLVYCVRDNGIGFDMAYHDKMFGVFQRLHGNEDFEGTGVGLAIVQRIIHRHGGRVWAEGGLDQGAAFFFSLKNKE